MKKKTIGLILLGVIALVIGTYILIVDAENRVEPKLGDKVFSEIFEINTGYGYKIISGNKVIIKQNFIPSVSGKIPFKSYIEAKEVADLVITKIVTHQNPTITKKNIEELGITIPDEE